MRKMKMHGLFINDADTMKMGKILREKALKGFHVDPRNETAWPKPGYFTPEYLSVSAVVPAAEFLSYRENENLMNWKITYCYPPIEEDYDKGVFINARGKNDREFIRWIDRYLGDDFPDKNWALYIADCDVVYRRDY